MTTHLLDSTDSSNGRNWRRAVLIQQSRPNLASDPQLRNANRPPPMSGGRVMAPGVGIEPTTYGLTEPAVHIHDRRGAERYAPFQRCSANGRGGNSFQLPAFPCSSGAFWKEVGKPTGLSGPGSGRHRLVGRSDPYPQPSP